MVIINELHYQLICFTGEVSGQSTGFASRRTLRVAGAKKASTKHVEPYNRTRFALRKGTSKSAPGMRFIIGFYIFHVFFENCVEIVKSEKSYTTVRFGPLKDVLVKGAGIGAVIGFYTF